MKKDPLKQFVQLHDSLTDERERLTTRLCEIHASLGYVQSNESNFSNRSAPRIMARNELSLKEAILKVTAKKALTKQEIHQAVLELGYTFSTNDPLNSIGVIIYGKKPKFINKGGRFSCEDR